MKTLFITIFTFFIAFAIAQPSLSFQRCYGGTGNESANKMFDMNGNGFLVFGETSSNDGDVSGNHGGNDIWVFRNDSTGNIIWQKCFGGSADETLLEVYSTNDGGYMMLGLTSSNDGDVSGNMGMQDVWIFKMDSLGTLLWQNCIGGSDDEPYSGGWLTYYADFKVSTQSLDIYFCSISNDGDMSSALGMADIWNVSINTSGNTIIQNTNSTIGDDQLLDVWELGGNITLVYFSDNGLNIGNGTYPYDATYYRTTDGGYIVGYYEKTANDEAYWCEKFSNTGFNQGGGGMSISTDNWTWGYLISGNSYATPEGFFLEVRYHSYGINAGATGDYVDSYLYDNDATVVESCTIFTDISGDGWSSGDCPVQITGTWPLTTLPSEAALEGGFIGFSSIYSNNNFQIYVEKNTFSHALEWTKSLGGTGNDSYRCYIQRPDTSYWMLGTTNSNNGDVSGNHGNNDIWLTHSSPANNWISGYVWEDVNANSTIDVGDLPLSNLLLQAQTTPGNVAYDITEANGKYEMNVGIGNLVLSAPNLPLYHVLQPATDTVTFSNNNGNIDSLHIFLMVEIPNMQDLRITLTALSTPHTSMNRAYDLTYKNVGTQASNATIRYVFDGNEVFTSASPLPDTLTATYASWNINNILPSQMGSISLVTHINPLASGLTITSTAMIYPFANDQYLADNTEILQAVATTLNVGLPFDPNDKLVSPAGNPILSTFLANEKYLTYTIRFQNTGTAPATKVVLKDTLSLLLDIKTLEILSASHEYEAAIEGSNKLVITYDNIMLPDSSVDYLGSQGFIKFRIKPKSPVGFCQEIDNKSSIYFDFNTPVMTNEVSTFFLPDAPNITSVMNPLCVGTNQSVSFSLPPTGFHNEWTSNGGSFSAIANDTVLFHGYMAGNHQIVLTQNIANIAGCSVSSPPVDVLIHPLPSLTLTNYNYVSLCQGKSVTLMVSLDKNYTYSWYNGDTFTGVTANSYTVTHLGNYHLKVYTSHGCFIDYDNASITVYPSPTITSTLAVGNTTFSLGDSVLLTSTATPANVAFQWQINGMDVVNCTTESIFAKLNGDYRVIVENSYNCTDTSALISVTVYDLTNELINLTVFPNPAQDELTISWESLTDANAKISLTDIAGKQVYTHTLQQKPQNTITFLVANLAQGSYLLRIEENNKILAEKVIVKR